MKKLRSRRWTEVKSNSSHAVIAVTNYSLHRHLRAAHGDHSVQIDSVDRQAEQGHQVLAELIQCPLDHRRRLLVVVYA